jgi:hypothetical protein
MIAKHESTEAEAMLSEFLARNRKTILALSHRKGIALAGSATAPMPGIRACPDLRPPHPGAAARQKAQRPIVRRER